MSSLCQTRSPLCLFFVYPAYHIGKSKPGACLRRKRDRQARATTERAVRGCEGSTKEPSPQTVWSPKIRERLVVAPRSTARSCRSLSFYGRVLAASSQELAARSKPVCFFVQSFVDFARSVPGHSLWVCLHPGPWIFLRNDKYGQEMKTSSKCPTSAIASPHVKYVKGC